MRQFSGERGAVHSGKVLLIANPAAQNGNGAKAARVAEGLLRAELGDALTTTLTERAGHAVDLAAAAANYDVVVALGGDGVVHEIANGLMRIAECDRPALGMIPVGSGNDYARTLGVSAKVSESVAQLLTAQPRKVDVGCCNGEYFLETLSFGLDAAIALGTVERRKKTGRTGTIMYVESGIGQLLHNLRAYRFTATLENAAPLGYSNTTNAAAARGAHAADAARAGLAANTRELSGETFLCAVQIGKTYGGGFLICPEARIDDGLFDICIARPPLSVPRALYTFLRAKNGGHVKSKQVEFHRAQSLTLRFEEEPPTQLDGEAMRATEFRITSCPRALQVLMS